MTDAAPALEAGGAVPAGGPGLVRRWAQLLVAFAAYGLAISLMLRSGLGLGPWDAFHQGLHVQTGITVGVASIVVGLVIVLGSLAIGVRPGPGTVANMILIGVFTDLLLAHTPPARSLLAALAYYAVALVISGPATGMYIAAGLGSGPRDGLMLALSERSGWPVRRVRFALELLVLGAGWALGGTIGLGTILFAVAVGPIVQWGLRLYGVLPARRPDLAAAAEAAAELV
ncbi:MAG TPA: hypothetical protein VFS40_04940 [Gemmatimonadales bacterium]|nr:hypothetical protein [Gemmatimonadales bacterium]